MMMSITRDARDNRDINELLEAELSFVELGGYGRSVRTPWLAKSVFQDSPTCINYADPNHTHPCSECHLLDFVDAEHQAEQLPCHFIPVNEAGDTIADLEAQDNQPKLERTMKQWLRNQAQEQEAGAGGRSRRQEQEQQSSDES
jgi:hypothetical protein